MYLVLTFGSWLVLNNVEEIIDKYVIYERPTKF